MSVIRSWESIHAMTWSTLADVAPILMLILVGVVVRSTRLIDERGGMVLTRLAYYVTLPATIYLAIANAQVTPSMLTLGALGFGIPVLMASLLYLTTRRLAGQPEIRGVMLVATVVLVVFGYPFFQLFFGAEGLARLAMFDAGNAIYAGSVALWLAQRHGQRPDAKSVTIRGVLTSPLLMAVVLAMASSVSGVMVGGAALDFLHRLSAANAPVVMIAVGVFIRPRASHAPLVAQYVLIRMFLGGLIGCLAAFALGLRGLDVVTACSASTLPAGTTALIYATNEGLDAEFAASIISATVVVGSVIITVLPHVLAAWFM
ncbi:MAG: AEC family transporter [Anaerolineae bacterium]